uniref:Uncharacterized protein n=1 Tax=Cannabis sativa TaxID=3483 RepID=A0A803NR56_CANSA
MTSWKLPRLTEIRGRTWNLLAGSKKPTPPVKGHEVILKVTTSEATVHPQAPQVAVESFSQGEVIETVLEALEFLRRRGANTRETERLNKQTTRSNKEVVSSQPLPPIKINAPSAQLPRDRTSLPPLPPSRVILSVHPSSLSEEEHFQLEVADKFFVNRFNMEYDDMKKIANVLSTRKSADFVDAARWNEPLPPIFDCQVIAERIRPRVGSDLTSICSERMGPKCYNL